MTRKAWIKSVVRKLNAHYGDAHPNSEQMRKYNEWAEAIAETFYDPCPNEYTPAEAAYEDVSNA